MITRRLAVFSGIDTRVIDKIGPTLRSMATDIAFVRIGSDGVSPDYFSRLLARAFTVAGSIASKPDVRLHALLVSAELSPDDWEIEAEHFFPALRRLEVGREFRRDVNRAQSLVRIVNEGFASQAYLDLARQLSPQGEVRLLLPVVNTKLDRLRRRYVDIYRLAETTLSRRLERDINRRRGNKGFRVQGLDFRGVVNDGTHPIRRCTDSAKCDLHAMMRFGIGVPERFEFDVSCDTGLNGKTFRLCDGTPVRIPRGTTHLNMRINDDFLAA